MTAVSGQYGCVKIGSSAITEVDTWSLSRQCVVHEYATCSTASGTNALAGRRKHSGSMGGLQSSSDPIENYFEEGDSVTLKLYWTATNFYSGTAVIETLDIEDVDITEGAPVRWSSNFKANGLFTSGSD